MKQQSNPNKNTRREFCKKTAMLSGTALFPWSINSFAPSSDNPFTAKNNLMPNNNTKSIIGSYGPWLAKQRPEPGNMSFRHDQYTDVGVWKNEVMPEVRKYISSPDIPKTPVPTTKKRYQYDGLDIEELEWAWPYGHPTKAILLKPAGVEKPLPAILGLHDHGGNKYFGRRKITKTDDNQHPMMKEHQEHYYEGNAWANEIAKKGYVVLVHDVFTFGSRRVRYNEMAPITWGLASTKDKSDENPEKNENIEIYNDWAAAHEHVMAKSLFCGGTTWPGMFLIEDQVALSILADREEVDENRMGCAGLSGGGLRTDFLGGMDHRIKCAVSAGFMTTWDDLMLNKSYTHTWMTYIPLLPQFIDFPEIACLRMPLPTMVQSSNEDQLFTLPEMKRSARIMEDNYAKAGASDKISCRFYPGPHKFDATMQKDAFDWFDRWLK